MIKKAVISNMAWIDKKDLSDAELFLLKKKLTVIPTVTSFDADAVNEPIYMYKEDNTRIGVPRRYWQKYLLKDGANEILDVSDGRALRQFDPLPLREEDQAKDVYKFVEHLKSSEYSGGIFEAYTGYGKTYSSFDIIRRLGGNAFILVHKEPLMNQWIENARKVFKGVNIGIVQGDECSYIGKDIVIGMVQTLMRSPDKFPYDFYRYFRTFVCDEVHRFGAASFGSVAPLFNSRYMVGLSGTVRRKDNCENVFRWVIGDIETKASQVNRLKPIVYIRETGFKVVRTEKFNMDEFQKPTIMNFLSTSKSRNHLIAQDIVKALKAGRSPLVMAERLEMLERISGFVYELGQKEFGRNITQGMYIGGKTDEELKRASACEVVYATSQLAQEGIDIPKLDTIFMATPMSDPEQAIGRVTRTAPDKKQPMVVDYRDSEFNKLEGIFYSRVKLYKRLGWQIIGIRL